MKTPRFPYWARWLLAVIAIFLGLGVLLYVAVVGPLFYACAVNGDCV